MIVVYIAGPYRAWNDKGKPDLFGVQENVMRAMTLGLDIWQHGGVAIVPHANTMFYTGARGIRDEVWLDGDLEIIRRCDAVLLTPDWRTSQGAIAEKAFAESIGLPVFLDRQSCLDWMEDSRDDTRSL